MEDLPKKLPQRVLKTTHNFSPVLENCIDNTRLAELVYEMFQDFLKKYGLDLTNFVCI